MHFAEEVFNHLARTLKLYLLSGTSDLDDEVYGSQSDLTFLRISVYVVSLFLGMMTDSDHILGVACFAPILVHDSAVYF